MPFRGPSSKFFPPTSIFPSFLPEKYNRPRPHPQFRLHLSFFFLSSLSQKTLWTFLSLTRRVWHGRVPCRHFFSLRLSEKRPESETPFRAISTCPFFLILWHNSVAFFQNHFSCVRSTFCVNHTFLFLRNGVNFPSAPPLLALQFDLHHFQPFLFTHY